jgi:hypothetical protein
MDTSQIPTRFALVSGNDAGDQPGVGLIYTGGTCAIITQGGDTVTLPSAWAGIVLPIAVKRVLAAGTTATSIGLFR